LLSTLKDSHYTLTQGKGVFIDAGDIECDSQSLSDVYSEYFVNLLSIDVYANVVQKRIYPLIFTLIL
jgi:hypothetical protein